MKDYYEWINSGVECWVWIKFEGPSFQGSNAESGQYFQCIVESIQKEKSTAKVKLIQKNEYQSLTYMPSYCGGSFDAQFAKLMEREQESEQTHQGYPDMVYMKYLNEAEILNNLRKRYQQDIIYTYIGPTLVVMNPYKDIEGISGNEVIEEIKKELGIIANDEMVSNKRGKIQNIQVRGHTYTVSGIAYKQMFENKKNQAIVISGESGAGKTENAKLSMSFLTSLSSGSQNQNDLLSQLRTSAATNILMEEFNQFAIEVKILACNPILEAFGNAKTVRNNNSSRFGKYVKIYIDKISKKIQGASIDNYLLEKSRIPCPGKGERNYHIFYHLLKGSQELNFLKLNQYKSPSEFEYLKKSECYEVENIQDSKLYLEVKKSFRQMNFNNIEQEAIFSLLSAILQLGNSNLDSSKASDTQASKFQSKEFKNVCDLLQVNVMDLEEALVFKIRKVGPTIIKSPQTPEECISMRDSLSKNLYDSLFNFLVWKLNQNLLPPQDLLSKCLSIGLLDIFGFESFDFNSFEQLCINFTNEKFQQLYVQYVFKSEEEDYKQEGILDVFANLQYQENQLIIDTIEKKPTGILVLLDENCSLGSGTDDSFLNQIIKNHSKNTQVSFPKKDKNSFCLSHTAKQVIYNAHGFRDKNKDEVSSEVEKCLSASQNSTIAQLLSFQQGQDKIPQTQQIQQEQQGFPKLGGFKSMTSSIQNKDPSTPAKKAVKFLGQKFRQSLQELMVELNNSDVHFIRCIKPNEEKKKDFFRYDFVYQQVQYLGLLDSIKIRKFGYSYRITYENFFLDYQELGQKTKGLTLQKIQQQKLDLKQLVITEIFEKTNLLQNRNLPSKSVAFGKTKMFLKGEVMKILHEKIQEIVNIRKVYAKKIIVSIQKFFFRKNFQINLAKIKKKLLKVQSFVKMFIYRRRFLKKKKAVIKMKRLIRIRHLGQGILAFRLKQIQYVWDMVAFMIFSKTKLNEAFQALRHYQKPVKKQEIPQVINNPSNTLSQAVQSNTETKNQVVPQKPLSQLNRQTTTENKLLLTIVNEINQLNQASQKQSQNIQYLRNSRNVIPQINFNPNRNTTNRTSSTWRQTLVTNQTIQKKDAQLQQIDEQKISQYETRSSQLEKAKEKLKPKILQFTEHHPASQYLEANMELEIDLDEIDESEDFQGELDDIIEIEVIREIKKSKRTRWGISQTQEKIMRHQMKPISNPLTNINDLKNIITYEDTREAISIIRSIAQQNSLLNSDSLPTKRAVNFEDANSTRTPKLNTVSTIQSIQHTKSSLMNPRRASVRDVKSLKQIVQKQKNMAKTIKDKQYTPEERAINIFKTMLKCAGERKSRFNRHTNMIKILTLCNEDNVEMKEEKNNINAVEGIKSFFRYLKCSIFSV